MIEKSPASQNVLQADPSIFFVDRREVRGTEFITVLYQHDDERAEAMRSVLEGADIDILAIEQPGHNHGAARKNEAGLQQQNATAGTQRATTALMERSERKLFLLDVSENDPEYTSFVDARKAQETYAGMLFDLAYGDEVDRSQLRSVFLDTVTKTAQSYIDREAIIRRQLEGLADYATDKKVGVVLGGMHYRVLRNFGGATNNGLEADLTQGLPDSERLVEVMRSRLEVGLGPIDADDQLVTDALIRDTIGAIQVVQRLRTQEIS